MTFITTFTLTADILREVKCYYLLENFKDADRWTWPAYIQESSQYDDALEIQGALVKYLER